MDDQKRKERQENVQQKENKRRSQKCYNDIKRENSDFEFYYRKQNIVKNEKEWEKFLDTLLKPLPASFRISSFCRGQAQKIRDIIQGDYIQKCFLENEELSKELNMIPIPWYPNKLAWTMNYSKIEIRKSTSLNKFHRFLISETETGDISRQEAVSMIPPLLLDIKPGQCVLDMCAAPGSKTAQIIEMLHHESGSDFSIDDCNERRDNLQKLDGLIVANDVDNRRCYMLVHQSKRLHSPCVAIINHDASTLPDLYQTNERNEKELLKFDRVLADVPCSGDGTLRKNYDVWCKWNAGASNNFHYIQLKIAKRGLDLLAKDGIMAYSTCSLSPIENEAVVAQLLNQSNGALELIDISKILPELKFCSGLQDWIVMSRDNQIYDSFDDVPENLRSQIRESLFPPQNRNELNLNFCCRILPHYQDTGGFFISLLRKKVTDIQWKQQQKDNQSSSIKATSNQAENQAEEKLTITSTNESTKKRKRKYLGHREDPFSFLDPNDPDWISLKNYYQFSETLGSKQFAHRCSRNGKRRNIYYLSEKAADFIRTNDQTIKIITAGCRAFNRVDVNKIACSFRITQEGIPSIFPYFARNLSLYDPLKHSDPRKFKILRFDLDCFVELLKSEDLKTEQLSEKIREQISSIESGCCILYTVIYNNDTSLNGLKKFLLPICVWKGKNSLRAYVAKNERVHLLRLCGYESTQSPSLQPSSNDSECIEISA
ncbi:tRNA (cytosine(34)-C(5))-methyltransferase-like protein [Sarcoptes scabiei]|uniref:tRNA (cytosine(34)-C(5))-methyltransferase n=1 Tax=Sarcoptes scabiei TaxID=52283 RepID=A0A132ADN3_SARSC|nr:tRNA (cytosine(34)-C(5))-methyltransferase-like protein [Sarcoptes scabiei]